MLSILTDTQKAIVDTMTMRLSIVKSLEYLKEHGFEMSRRNYFRQKKKVQSLRLKRLYHIEKIGFEEQHLERIDQLRLIQELMWKNYDACKNAYQRSKILRAIADVQPLLSAYYDSTHYVVSHAREDDYIANNKFRLFRWKDALDNELDNGNDNDNNDRKEER
jgi:hypothetical protein